MSQKYILLIITLTLYFASFLKETRAQSADVTSGCAPLTVNFNAGAVAGPWLWNLGGTNSALENPTRVFTAPGTYTIELNQNFVTTITVYANPVAGFGVNGATSGCASPSSPLNINFVDQSTSSSGNIVSWLWDFGDGNSSTQQNPSHAYTSTGVFTVTLQVRTQFGCENTIVMNDLINANGSADVRFEPRRSQRSCEAPFAVQFTNNSTGLGANPSYIWEVFAYDNNAPQGIGAPLPSLTTTEENPLINFTSEGRYTVRLSINDATGCSAQYVRSQLVVIESYVLGFTYTLSPSIPGQCIPVQGTFRLTPTSNVNASFQTLVWEFLDASNNIIGTIDGQANRNFTRNPVYNFSVPGTYRVRLSASGTRDNCPLQVYDEQTIIIPDVPIPAFSSTNNASCAIPHTVNFDASPTVNATSYSWDFDNDGAIDFTSTAPTTTHTYTQFGNYDVRLIVSDGTGCQVDTVLRNEVMLEPVRANLVALQPLGCNDTNGDYGVGFRDRSSSPVDITDWTWEFIDAGGNIVGTIQGSDPGQHQNPGFVFNTDPMVNNGIAQYSVRLTIQTAAGCQDDTLFTNYIQVGNKPVAAFSSNPPIGCPQVTSRNFIYEGSMPYDSLYWFPLGVNSDIGLGIRYPGDDPNHSYTYNAVPTAYYGALVVFNGGCSDTTNYSSSNPGSPSFLQLAPYPGASWYRDDCDPSAIYFVDESLGPHYWRWTFGDGSPVVEGAIRDYLPGEVPGTIRNPRHQYASPGNYSASIYIETDNVYYVTDSTGDRLKNQHFLATGNPQTYTRNDAGELLHFGELVTEDSVIITRCSNELILDVDVPDFSNIQADIRSDYSPAAQNCFPVTVNFQDNTNDPEIVSWYWSLGNGDISYLPNPSTTYTQAGKYTVELVVTNQRGCKFRQIFPDYIHVKGPLVNFEFCDADVCIDDPNRVEDPPVPGIRFRDFSTSSVPILYRTWDMGNGTVFSNDPGVTGTSTPPVGTSADLHEFTYQYPPIFPNRQIDGFEVTLTVTDESNCQSSQTIKVRPTLPDPSDFDLEVHPFGCNSDSIQVSLPNIDQAGFAPFRYTWTVTDNNGVVVYTRGPTNSRRATFVLPGNTTTTPVSPKNYFITLRLEDFKYNNNDEGCYAEFTKAHIVDPIPPEPDFDVNAQNGCGTLTVQFNNLSTEGSRGGVNIPVTEWFWEFGDGTTSTEENPLKVYTQPGIYVPRLTMTDEAGCKVTKVFGGDIRVQGTLAQLQAVKLSGTSPDPTTPISSGSIIDFVEAVSGTPYSVEFSVINVVDINAVGQFVWDFGDGVVIATPNTQTQIQHTYVNPGVYTPTLSIIDAADPTCQYPTQNDISIVANGCNPPRLTPIPPTCPGTQITLTARAPLGTIFSPINPPFSNPVFINRNTGDVIPATVNTGTETTYTAAVILTENTEYAFSITDSALPSPCTSTASITVEALPATSLDVGEDQLICVNGEVTLQAQLTEGEGEYDFVWTSVPDIGSSSGTITFNQPGPVDFPPLNFTNMSSNTVFTLNLTPKNGQSCPATDRVLVEVSAPPTVDAGPDLVICHGESTQVNGSASGGVGVLTYAWGAPSGLESSIANPNQAVTTITLTNTASNPVTHTFTLTVTDELGCVNTNTVAITVQPEINISGFSEVNICPGDQVQFTGNVSGGSGNFSYQWTSNNGIGSLNATDILNPMATPLQSTTYTLLVTDNTTACTKSIQVRILINPPIRIDAGPDRSVCVASSGIVLQATASGGTGSFTYQWSPTTFLDDPTSLTPTVNNITTTTEYTLTVTDLDAAGNPNCSIQDKVVIIVKEPIADAGLDQEICVNTGTLLMGSANSGIAPYQFDWVLESYTGSGTLDDADGLTNTDVLNRSANPRFLANNPSGTYVYALSVEDVDGCTSVNETKVTITVNPLPDAPNVEGELAYCRGETISLTAMGLSGALFRWYNEDPTVNPSASILMVDQQFTAVGNASGAYFVTQEDLSTGCVSLPRKVDILIHPIPPAPVISTPPDYCAGDVLEALFAEGEMIRWYDPQGNLLQESSSYLPTVTTQVTIQTQYSFFATQTINDCESPQAEVVITVYPIPPPPQVAMAPNCETDAALNPFEIVNPVSGTVYRWYSTVDPSGIPGGLLMEGVSFTPSIAVNLGNDGTKFYATQTVNGCESPPQEISTEINQIPTLEFEPQFIHCFEQEGALTIDAGPGTSYLWFDGSTGQTVRVSEPGRFTFEVFNAFGCSDTASIEVIDLCPARLFVPTAFTPNNDGKSDHFQAFGKYLSDLDLKIYNEWGEVIYMIEGLEGKWDGSYRGKLVPLGTYVWKARYFDILGNRFREEAGTVTVIH